MKNRYYIKKVNDANIDYWYYVIERENHTTIYSNNYKSEKTAERKLNNKLEEIKYE